MEKSHDSNRPPIPQKGLTVVVNPDNPAIESIVFVHGFTGHPERTWKAKSTQSGPNDNRDYGSEPPSKFRKLYPGSLRGKSSRNYTYWPCDLLPFTIPPSRVLTYGYDTRVRHWLGAPPCPNTVYDIAGNFLIALEAERREEPSRPLVFIAHSLGGIVVTEMLRRYNICRLSQKSHLLNIFESTKGIIFFGTPHSGADPRGCLLHIVEKIIKAAGFSADERIVNTLLPSSERLKELRAEFIPLACEMGWVIHSFQEALVVKVLQNRKVVEDTSSCLSSNYIETTEHIAKDHMEMCRFSGPEDTEYKKVAAALHRICGSAAQKNITTVQSSSIKNDRTSILNSLKFDAIDSRHTTIRNAHSKTCDWLLSKSEYCDWLDVNKLADHHGFLWIKGKPGTGKSTIMKYALGHAREEIKDRIIVHFFFNARGDELETSTSGMFRSLLFQLFEKIPELLDVFDTLELIDGNIKPSHIWTLEALMDLFERAVKSLGDRALICYVDALDECDETQTRQMVAFFEHLGEQAIIRHTCFHVCFSSRHYPHITIKKGLCFVLEGQEGHSSDIAKYLESELKIGGSELANQIKAELMEKASGVFMWVVLAVQIMNAELDSGRVHAIRRRLRGIPTDLHELFRDILTRDNFNKDELLLCIQWVLFAKRPLSPIELYFAILSGTDPEYRPEDIPEEVMEKFVLSSSKGLVEVTGEMGKTVQFIHESVRDFLLKEKGFKHIWPSHEATNFKGRSNEWLEQCCTTYLNLEAEDFCSVPHSLLDIERGAANRFPFIKYAFEHSLDHAEAAASEGVLKDEFIRRFPLSKWIKLFHMIRGERYPLGAGLLHILAGKNLPNLFTFCCRHLPEKDPIFGEESEDYRSPLFEALTSGSKSTVHALLKLEANHHPSSNLPELFAKWSEDSAKRLQYVGNSKRRGENLIRSVIKHGDITLFAFLLETGRLHVNKSCNSSGGTPILVAAAYGHLAIVSQLLKKRADENKTDDNGSTPLLLAAQGGHYSIVELLLSREKNLVDLPNVHGETPLLLAAKEGHSSVVELLLSQGRASTKLADKIGNTPLSMAAKQGHRLVVETLLSRGQELVDLANKYRETPLLLAAKEGHSSVVELLLSTGQVSVGGTDNTGWTSLSWAAINGYHDVFKLLLPLDKVGAHSTDYEDRSLLHWAALSRGTKRFSPDRQRKYLAVATLLLNTGIVDPDARDATRNTPLILAAKSGNSFIVELLLSTGRVAPDTRNEYGETPLLMASMHGHDTVVEMLLSTERVDPDAASLNNETPYFAAQYHGHGSIAARLLATGKVDRKQPQYTIGLHWLANYYQLPDLVTDDPSQLAAKLKALLSTGNLNRRQRRQRAVGD